MSCIIRKLCLQLPLRVCRENRLVKARCQSTCLVSSIILNTYLTDTQLFHRKIRRPGHSDL